MSLNVSETNSGPIDCLQSRSSSNDGSSCFLNISDFRPEYELMRSRVSDSDVIALLFIDADNLKRINDALGHRVGDLMILEIANILAEALPKGSVFCRKGGDEFIACFTTTEAQLAENIAYEVCCILNCCRHVGSHELAISCSVGMDVCNKCFANFSDQLNHSDIAMYWAKSCGKGQLRVFDFDECSDILEIHRLCESFPSALAGGDLSFEFQPLYDVSSRTILGAEALIRWAHPEFGNVNACKIIDVASKCGKISEVGLFILRLASRQAKNWPEGKFLSVNFSALDFNYPRFAASVISVLQEVKMAPYQLKVEITEGEKLEDSEVVKRNIEGLRSVGVSVGIDDFGAGYSSMSSLDKFSVDFVKIDRSLICECDKRKSSKIFIKAIKDASAVLGLDVIAEGVETLSEAVVVRGLGIRTVQGYYFQRPISPDLMSNLLEVPVPDSFSQRKAFHLESTADQKT